MNCYSMQCAQGGMRQFLTKKEKIEMLSEYKEELEQEAKGITERIKELSDESD